MHTGIEPLAFHGALMSGARMVEGKRDELNRINGFPVPDRDTGSNLAYLMQVLRRQLPIPKGFEDLLTKLGEAALMGARGNSGAIFSQFFAGFRTAACKIRENIHESLPLQALAEMFREGYASAYRSIQAPREGTILSAMHSFGEAFHQLLAQGHDLARAAEGSLHRLRDTVRESMNILPQQRALRAPDAGAMAFLYFTEGFMRSLLGQADDQAAAEDNAFFELPAMEESPHADIADDTRYRYCTEVLLTKKEGARIDEAYKARLITMGDSLVVSQTEQMARVHLHTNTPAEAVDLLEGLGTVNQVKTDDMLMQQALSRSHPGRVALVIDSIADVPENLLGPHVYCLPLHLLADGVSYQDKRSISLERMRRLAGKLSSSQLNLEEIRQFLDPILRSYPQALILTVSSKMSGIHDRFREYLAQNPDKRVRLVDSRVNSGAEGLLALRAARRLQEGAGLDELAEELEKLRERAKVYVSLPHLRAMVSSGRLNKRIGRVLQAVGFLPLITINREGEGTVTGLAFSRARSDKLLMKKIVPGRIETYGVVHANNPARAQKAALAIQGKLGIAPSFICEISSIVTLFAGEGAYAVAFIEKEPEQGRAS